VIASWWGSGIGDVIDCEKNEGLIDFCNSNNCPSLEILAPEIATRQPSNALLLRV
jgi:hypothetical protein